MARFAWGFKPSAVRSCKVMPEDTKKTVEAIVAEWRNAGMLTVPQGIVRDALSFVVGWNADDIEPMLSQYSTACGLRRTWLTKHVESLPKGKGANHRNGSESSRYAWAPGTMPSLAVLELWITKGRELKALGAPVALWQWDTIKTQLPKVALGLCPPIVQ